ncbi:FMN-dependent oxidoreductase (nitrilotriacetate monooxygenase family) [Arthrobacter sp. PvP023]|uniref:LLM class flavin-dependent oxidoreductase n=1 Tax=Micrococcaceae TaxID=1268 RepID=UPI001AE28590|nr:LLM class flavin-dependent oxidoreductase [Arthrobacter sp. PvP023]MBP1137031.1 FMN-dependent oxidoreductase (nitrilotriacetate monooxygenase family) [Arthrobacter sp. PvP023]
MASHQRTLHLNAFLMSTGHHEASWRLPESNPRASTDIRHYRNLARIAERGTFDSIFFADSPVIFGNVGRRPAGKLEPTVLLTAIAAATEKIGLIATASTTYNEPFNLARRFASVDFVSGGRAGWNVVTTVGPDAARNFGVDDQPAHATRYERAAEFLDVAGKLWDSWDDDAVVADKEAGVWADPDKVRPIDHVGKHFRVRGPLNVPRSPQGHPLIVQAGSSEDGKGLAARYAEAVFTAQQTLEDAQGFYSDLKARTAAAGRDPEGIKILPGIVPVLAGTEAEAKELERELDELIRPEYARIELAKTLGVSPDDLPLDRQLPADLPDEDSIQGAKSRYTLIVELGRREQLTVRQLIGRLGGGRGHRTFSGTPEQVADAIQLWFENGAADGFNIMPAVLPSGLEAFVEHVVPVLRQRGLFRTEYTADTLRGHYGLERPLNRYSGAAGLAAVHA